MVKFLFKLKNFVFRIVSGQKFEMTLICKSEKRHGTPVDIYFRLFGPKVGHIDEEAFTSSVRRGDFAPLHPRCSPIIRIPSEYININGTAVFTFNVDGSQRLSPCSKLALGHDTPAESTDWLCEEVLIYQFVFFSVNWTGKGKIFFQN